MRASLPVTTATRLTVLCIMLAGCQPSRAISEPPAPVLETVSTASAAPTVAPVEEPDDAAVTEALEDMRRVSNPLDTVAVRGGEKPKKGYRGIPERRKGAFPGVPFAEVRAYAFRFNSRYNLDEEVPSCVDDGDQILAKDGTLCPSVVLPGARLSSSQAERLVDLIRHPSKETYQLRCGERWHHAFVFYDTRDLPVAEVMVDFSCGAWEVRPAPQGIKVLMYEHEGPILQLCRDLRLGGCSIGDEALTDKLDAFYERRKKANGGTLPPRELIVSGLDDSLPLRTLSALDRRKLCAVALDARFKRSAVKLPSARVGVDCPIGPAYDLVPLAQCAARAPLCDVPIGRAQSCDRALLADICFEKAETRAACDGVAACLPDVVWKRLPEGFTR